MERTKRTVLFLSVFSGIVFFNTLNINQCSATADLKDSDLVGGSRRVISYPATGKLKQDCKKEEERFGGFGFKLEELCDRKNYDKIEEETRQELETRSGHILRYLFTQAVKMPAPTVVEVPKEKPRWRASYPAGYQLSKARSLLVAETPPRAQYHFVMPAVEIEYPAASILGVFPLIKELGDEPAFISTIADAERAFRIIKEIEKDRSFQKRIREQKNCSEYEQLFTKLKTLVEISRDPATKYYHRHDASLRYRFLVSALQKFPLDLMRYRETNILSFEGQEIIPSFTDADKMTFQLPECIAETVNVLKIKSALSILAAGYEARAQALEIMDKAYEALDPLPAR